MFTIDISNSLYVQEFEKLVKSCTAGQKVEFFIFMGQIETVSGRRAYGYKRIASEKPYVIEGSKIIFDEIQELSYCETVCLANKIEGSWSIGYIIAVKTEKEGKAFFTKTSLGLDKFEDSYYINEWEATQQRLAVLKLAKAKNKGFDDRMKHSLQETKEVYRRSDNITRQYIVAKIIYFLNN